MQLSVADILSYPFFLTAAHQLEAVYFKDQKVLSSSYEGYWYEMTVRKPTFPARA
jgi:hypothetical protein